VAVGVLGPPGAAARWERLQGGDLSRTWRVSRTGASPAIVKWTRFSDAGGFSREALAYDEVLGSVGVRTAALLGSGSDGEASCLVLEDLAGEFRFPPNRHRWAPAELQSVVRAYARLHTEGSGIGRRPWMLGYQSPDWTPESVTGDAGELRRRGEWGALSGLERLAGRTLDDLGDLDEMPTLLHLDCDPSNAGIGVADPGEVALIDWDMAGWGDPEFDLAYLHLHPFEAAGSVDRARLLDVYWTERSGIGPIPDARERRIRQRVADRVFALALVAGARRSLDEPYPPGGRADRYWAAMRPVLYRKLEGLVAG
jgi:fructosamine-3-kinase